MMKKRNSRLSVIADILTHNKIGSQEQLSQLLHERGFEVTQATLSRDLKMLKTIKVATDDGYRYIIADHSLPSRHTPTGLSSASTALSIAISGNLVVIKTRNGYASGLAYDIDMMESPHVLGTIPGADTVLVVVNEKSSRAELYLLFSAILPSAVMQAAKQQFID